MNSDNTYNSCSDRQDEFERAISYSQQDYLQFYHTQQSNPVRNRDSSDVNQQKFENQVHYEDEEHKDNEVSSSYQCNQTQPNAYDTITRLDQDISMNQQVMKQYQTQALYNNNQKKSHLMRDGTPTNNKMLNVFSNSFDESAPQLELKPQRNCKSSTRISNGQKRQNTVNQIPIPIVQNIPQNGVLTSGSLNNKQGAFNNYMKQKQQIQSTYQQAILNQYQRTNTQNSFEIKNNQELSNRSMVLTPGGQTTIMSNQFAINQFLYGTQTMANRPITPHTLNGSNQGAFQSMILSAGSGINPRNGQSNLNQSSMDPYVYLKWKQQKYKSCRSNQATNGQIQKQNSNSYGANILQSKKGNQTQKHNQSSCSSSGSVYNTSTTTMTGAVVKTLADVKNPQYFISFRFTDRKLTELKDISNFKNLSELDISGNLLKDEVSELKQLQFLKKLNLSNNQIQEMYSVPQNLEILNLSYNNLKKLSPEVTQNLRNLTTLDISNNGLESLDGVQNLKRLKRLLSKNNQIQDLQPLQDLSTIIEIDLENNPVDSYQSLIIALQNKKDILVLNLKLSPIMLTIQNYEQLFQELKNNIPSSQLNQLEFIKKKLKFFTNGSLYRTKRVFVKVRNMLQHSKRSSSNFSNGSSSCGRANGVAFPGFNQPASNNNIINTSQGNAFSPIINNMSTPNQQHISQRLEDIEQLYDEILDEEEELERKIIRIQKKKQRKESIGQNNQMEDDSADEDEDESLYEDEDYINPTMSGEEDLDNLQSYRNHNQPTNEFLNESTADFNKEIRQINQELREQLGNEILGENGPNPEALNSLHSTQTLNTNQTRKNPISFKLDLSKCTQQQSEEEDNFEELDNLDDLDAQFEIPGLQHVKVTDDSFRQIQKQHSNLQSLRSQRLQAQEGLKTTQREQVPKIQQKSVIIPKLQLGMLQQKSNQMSIPIKQGYTVSSNNSKKSVTNNISVRQEQEKAKPVSQQEKQSPCQQKECQSVREELAKLKENHYKDLKQLQDQLESFKLIVTQIQHILDHSDDIKSLPQYLSTRLDKQKTSQDKIDNLVKQIEDLQPKYNQLQEWKFNYETNQQSLNDDYQQKFQAQESTIQQLQEQIFLLENHKSINNDSKIFNDKQLQNLDNDLKRVQSSQCQQLQILNNPQFFYSNSLIDYDSQERLNQEPISNELNIKVRKRPTCDIKRIKRPQSVNSHGQRKASQLIKINNLLKEDQGNMFNITKVNESQYTNEYGTTQDIDRQSLSKTMNKKVGHYLDKLKERNSSLQERLNNSFSGSIGKQPQQKVSPLNINKFKLNITQQQDLVLCNPYIISPSNDSITHQTNIPRTTNNKNLNLGKFSANLIKHISSKDTYGKQQDESQNIQHSEYSEREGQQKQHSKTQRIQVKKIQSNQFFSAQNKLEGDYQSTDQYQLKSQNDSVRSHRGVNFKVKNNNIVNEQSFRDTTQCKENKFKIVNDNQINFKQ